MVQLAETSLEARIRDLENQVRSLSTMNWTSKASVTNAAGRYVPLDQLAFGLVTAVEPALFEMNGGNPAPAPGGVGWFYGVPQLDVLVNGGNLVVFLAGALHAQGNKTGTYQSYRLLGPTATAGDPAAVVAAAPSNDRSVQTFDPGVGQGTDLQAGTFGVHTGLAAGWYRVQSAYSMSFSGGMFTYGTASNRRIAALPF